VEVLHVLETLSLLFRFVVLCHYLRLLSLFYLSVCYLFHYRHLLLVLPLLPVVVLGEALAAASTEERLLLLLLLLPLPAVLPLPLLLPPRPHLHGGETTIRQVPRGQ